MPRPTFSNVRLTIYVTPETAERIRAAAGRRPLGHAVDDAFALPAPATMPVKACQNPLANETRRMRRKIAPIKETSPALHRAVLDALHPSPSPHPIACQCEACTLARLRSPQIRKAKRTT